MGNFVFFSTFSSQSCLSDQREIYELTKVKQVRRGNTSCHPHCCLVLAPSNTDTPSKTLLFAPLNPPTTPSLGPTSVQGRRKNKRGREGWRKGWTKFLRGARRCLVTDAIWQQMQQLRGILIVFSSIYGLHVCRWVLEWNKTMQESDYEWWPATYTSLFIVVDL